MADKYVKTTGALYKRFYEDVDFWGAGDSSDNTYIDGEIIQVNGKEVNPYEFDFEKLADDDTVSFVGGYIGNPMVGPADQSLDQYFKRWLKKQDYAILVFDVPKAREAEAREFLKSIGAKVAK